MLFNSFIFLGLLAVTFILYYLPRMERWQVPLLIAASLVFYAYSNPWLLLLLLFSAAINILASYGVVFGKPERRRLLATAGVVINLLVLAFFKYSPLLAGAFFSADSSLGAFLLQIPLPIGISFFTFEGISLLVDTYQGKEFNREALVPRSLGRHAQRTLLFISFFPHLVAGPILKAHDYLPQIQAKTWKRIPWDSVFVKVLTGYFLKLVVADNLKDFTFWIAYPYFNNQSTLTLVVMLLGYSCQIFADFAGYSLIAIGLAALFGYQFKDNFNFPYIADSFRDFWKRWHISLSSFLMEYLYIPLGGNRKGKFRTYLNLIITMGLGGLWHGAAWSYAVWGLFHGGLLAIERWLQQNTPIRIPASLSWLKRVWVFAMVTLGWLLFKLPDFNHVIGYFTSMLHNQGLAHNYTVIAYILLYASPVFLYHAFYLLNGSSWGERWQPYRYWVYGLLLFLIITNSGSPGSFIYFQF